FSLQQNQFQFVESIPWIPSWGISYTLGVDGISAWLMMLSTFVAPIAVISTWRSVHKYFRDFQILLLALSIAMLGVFLARDLFVFYVFWEFTLIPMALLIGIWGSDKRVAAATKFFLYTFSGSVFMLLSMIGLYLLNGQQTGTYTSNLSVLIANARGVLQLGPLSERLLFLGFFLAFAVKAPLWPFHTWLPLAHAEAPTTGSVDLAAVMLKLGGYGMIRLNLQLFPEASRFFAPAIGVLAVISILYGAIVSYSQTDFKRLVAYSSVSHMGFMVLGIFAMNAVGISGAVAQMVNHGLTASALFLIVGIIYERRHTREMAAFGGLWKVMPIYGSLSLVAVMASVGLPGLNGFVSEYTVLQGVWLSQELGPGYSIAAVIGVIIGAVYLLRMFSRVFMGDVTNPENAALYDIRINGISQLALALAPCVLLGLYPNILFGTMNAAVNRIAEGLTVIVASLP
ncbi:MAG TPA: NADH-quinone oxidoreductase subunit M, partial [Roseiflexaceae bacterium]|nr:NADH-quinone oxidoreductase subunit M [Roseiflexaceae bacterium]